MKHLKSSILIIVSFISGSLISLLTTLAFAHGGDSSLVHACVSTPLIPGTPNIRIVGAGTSCNGGETALDWTQIVTPGSELNCSRCIDRDLLLRLNSADFINENLNRANLSNAFFANEDFTGTTFINAILSASSFSGSDFTDTVFTNANIRGVNFQNVDFTDATLTDADMSTGADFSNSNFDGADLTNVNLTDSVVQGATNMDTATRTGITWSNTLCPDGTNSNDNSNTCEGHLTP